MLVAAVLGPEQGEDGELEVFRLALEKALDPLELPVRQAERAMQRLSVPVDRSALDGGPLWFGNLRQSVIVSPGPDGTVVP